MRTEKSLINLITSLFGQGLSMVLSFVTRMYFIKFLGETYLGINGLFSQVLSVLSLLELGVGTAIIYSLYKPLAKKEEKKILLLMNLYKKVYISVGILIAVIGVLISPFYATLMNETPDIDNLQIIFILFVANSSISYFFSYKQNLIIADQKKYITLGYHYIVYVSLCIIQIIVLYLTRNYILYLLLQILFTLIENIIISRKADALYPFLKQKINEKLDQATMQEIIKNTKALLFHKIGGIVVNATDNILISKLISVTVTGIYSNYLLITTSLTSLITQIFSALTSSIGNLHATEDNEKKINVFNTLYYANFIIYFVICICFICLVNDFIKIAFKTDLLTIDIVVLITINFFLSGMRQTILVFKDAMGIYWIDRFRPLAEGIINLVVSLVLFQFIGMTGIFLGTTISAVTTYLWIEPIVLFNNGLKKSAKDYFIKYAFYLGYTLLVGVSLYLLSAHFLSNGWISLIMKGIVLGITTLALATLPFYKTQEMQYFIRLMREILGKLRKKAWPE